MYCLDSDWLKSSFLDSGLVEKYFLNSVWFHLLEMYFTLDSALGISLSIFLYEKSIHNTIFRLSRGLKFLKSPPRAKPWLTLPVTLELKKKMLPTALYTIECLLTNIIPFEIFHDRFQINKNSLLLLDHIEFHDEFNKKKSKKGN